MNERDELWELMGKAKKPVVSPFFAANVLREIRQTPKTTGILEWLRHQWRSVGVAATALLVVGLTLNHWHAGHQRDESDRTLLALQVASNPDYDVINHLDELLAVQETSLWTDSSLE